MRCRLHRNTQKIKTLQRKLYAKAKQEPGYRFYALYDKVYRADILHHAYRLVRSNKGAPGIDGVSFAAIEAEEGVETFLEGLAEEVKSRTYRPMPVRRVMIPKADGSQRSLGIPTIRDRVVQMAVKLMIEPIFEADFCDSSYGFRPKRSAHDAMGDISSALRKGHCEVIDADLSKYFDTIPHAKLMAVVAERIADSGILHLIKQWLKAPVVEKGKDGKDSTSGGKGNRRGTPQGGVISPLLANLYLHLLDRIWERHGLERKYSARLVRYADDMVLLCAKGTAKPLGMLMLRYILDRLELTLNETKTKVVNAWDESFGFLGFEVRMNLGRSGKAYPHIQPSKSAVKRINAKVTALTQRNLTPIPLPIIVQRLNQSLRGWACYFDYANSTQIFGDVKRHAEERMRTHLRRRHKVKARRVGQGRFPNRVLYDHHGLFKLPTTAPWKRAHALA
ncbi:MAG: group II intron reverse transcriptase/maturase [Zetaproteobacteria bacterium CG_4_9_14_3_um_filter_54_145]|nr:MAG: group II intron reverse transcriptase/maturase [Zetaproteobacteria bacterium CG_4_10_14_3_um_filter_54_28]PJA28120.1 MAG: group II intron reverse transcriptase/maturase [Zetaproteobacteria bacterium CG_4_9_14_3_um_filter_54_145]